VRPRIQLGAAQVTLTATIKTLAIGTVLLLTTSGILTAQQVIENRDKPLSKNAGRVLKLQVVWRITDEDEGFYFKSPSDLGLSSDGSLFLADRDELLKFSPKGRYVKNLFKKGQGPGEIARDFHHVIQDDRIFIYDYLLVKIIQMDLDGNLVRQTRIETGPYSGFYGVYKNRFIFRKEIFLPPTERKVGLQNMPVAVKLVTEDGKSEENNCVFQKEMFIEGNDFITWTPYRTIFDDQNGLIYVAHAREYQIEVLDVNKGRMTNAFKRLYPSVPYKEGIWEKKFYKTHNVPKIRIEPDISGLYINQNTIWVRTSTTTQEKGDLIDLFDAAGRFIDNFYLGAGRTLLGARGDEIFVTEKNPDESVVLVKYKILE
jgi:hypothetical protein